MVLLLVRDALMAPVAHPIQRHRRSQVLEGADPAISRRSGWRMKALASLTAFVLAVCPIAALACDAGERPVFSCTTAHGKQVEVCQATQLIHYAYGAPGKPAELRLSKANEAFVWEHYEGVSSGIEDDLTFDNGSTRYLITHVADFDDPSKAEANIVVIQPGSANRYIGCSSGIRFDASAIKEQPQTSDGGLPGP